MWVTLGFAKPNHRSHATCRIKPYAVLREGLLGAVQAVLLLQQVQPGLLIVSRIVVIGRIVCLAHVILTRCCHVLSIALVSILFCHARHCCCTPNALQAAHASCVFFNSRVLIRCNEQKLRILLELQKFDFLGGGT